MTKKKRIIALLVLLIMALLLCGNCSVQAIQIQSEQQKADLQYQDTAKAETPSVFWIIVQMILALGLIIVLAWGAIQFLGSRINSRLQGQWIRVLDEVILGQNRGIVAVEIGGRVFLLGVTDHQISMLTELDDEQLIQNMIAAGYEKNQSTSSSILAVEGVAGAIDWLKDRITGGEQKQRKHFHNVMNDKVRMLEIMARRVESGGSNDKGKESDPTGE